MLAAMAAAVAAVLTPCWTRRLRINDRSLAVVRQVGEGGYSVVYACRLEAGPEPEGVGFAVKQMLVASPEGREAARAEIEAHLHFRRCARIAPLLDYTFTPAGDGAERVLLLLPLYTRGSLADVLARGTVGEGPFFPEAAALRLAVQIGEGLAALAAHVPPLAHRDVCPRNIMLDDAGDAVLIDLGSVAPASPPLATRGDAARLRDTAAAHSSQPYRAPELWEPEVGGAPVDGRTDVWSLGATLYALVFGLSPFESSCRADGRLRLDDCTHLRVISDVTFPSYPPSSPALRGAISWMLTLSAVARPTMAAVLPRLRALAAAAGAPAAATIVDDSGADFNPFARPAGTS